MDNVSEIRLACIAVIQSSVYHLQGAGSKHYAEHGFLFETEGCPQDDRYWQRKDTQVGEDIQAGISDVKCG